jgi:hypothetical protein
MQRFARRTLLAARMKGRTKARQCTSFGLLICGIAINELLQLLREERTDAGTSLRCKRPRLLKQCSFDCERNILLYILVFQVTRKIRELARGPIRCWPKAA